MSTNERLYRFHWRFNDKPSEGRGRTPEEAFSRLGYGAGALRVLDYYEQVDTALETKDGR